MLFKWTEDVAVGVDLIDSQHKALFDVRNSLVDAIDNNSGAAQVEGILGFLEGYVSEHFETEEKLMREVSCPGMEDHIEQHRIFVDSLEEIKKSYRSSGASENLLIMLRSSLCNWLFSHIMMVDKRMGLFLNKFNA